LRELAARFVRADVLERLALLRAALVRREEAGFRVDFRVELALRLVAALRPLARLVRVDPGRAPAIDF
jgi:hypothetical protein